MYTSRLWSASPSMTTKSRPNFKKCSKYKGSTTNAKLSSSVRSFKSWCRGTGRTKTTSCISAISRDTSRRVWRRSTKTENQKWLLYKNNWKRKGDNGGNRHNQWLIGFSYYKRVSIRDSVCRTQIQKHRSGLIPFWLTNRHFRTCRKNSRILFLDISLSHPPKSHLLRYL